MGDAKLLMDKRNVAAAIVLMLIAAVYGFLTADLPKRTLPDTPDPAFMPWINTILLGGLSLLLLVRGLAGRQPAQAEAGDAAAILQPVLFLTAVAGYIAVLPGLGFVLASVPFFAVAMLLFGERRKLWILLGAVATPILLFAVFRHGFSIVLPRGVMPNLFG